MISGAGGGVISAILLIVTLTRFSFVDCVAVIVILPPEILPALPRVSDIEPDDLPAME